MLGVLLGQLCDPLRDLGQSLGAGDQLFLRSSARAHQIGEVREEIGDLLGGRDDLVIRVVPLHQGKEKLCLKAQGFITSFPVFTLPVSLPDRGRERPRGSACWHPAPR